MEEKKIHSFIRVHIHNPPRACMTKREGYADQESESTVLNSGAIYIGNIDITKGKC